jgi:collagenase-like PrtC family protease
MNFKIIAPARSRFMLDRMIEAGANEIYVGLKPQNMNQLSFDGRFQTIADYPAHVEDIEQLNRIIQNAHEHHVKVIFMANANYIPKNLEKEYLTHVESAVSLGIDYITVSSIQSIKLIQREGIQIPLISGSVMSPTNIGTVKMLKDMGINRITVPHCIKLNEILELKSVGIDMMITGNFGSGSLPGSCRLWESPNNLEMGDGTRTVYKAIIDNQKTLDNTNLLDSATDCSLCSLEALFEAGIMGIKLIGREAPNPNTLSIVVDLFRQWVELGVEGKSIEEKIKVMEREQLMWTMKWEPRFCQKKRCSYLDTLTTLSYV